MSGRSDLLSSLDLASGALNAYTLKAQIAAYNIANVSTASFKPVQIELATGSNGEGVKASGVRRGEDLVSGDETESEISGTDLAREFVHLIESQNSFTANARVIGVIDKMYDSLLDIKT